MRLQFIQYSYIHCPIVEINRATYPVRTFNCCVGTNSATCPFIALTAQYIALRVFIVVCLNNALLVLFAYVYNCEFRPNTATCMSTNVVGLLQQSDMSVYSSCVFNNPTYLFYKCCVFNMTQIRNAKTMTTITRHVALLSVFLCLTARLVCL